MHPIHQPTEMYHMFYIDAVSTFSTKCCEATIEKTTVHPDTAVFIPGGYSEKFLTGCVAPVFGRIPSAKEILFENIPLAKENFLIMSPILHDFKEFQPKYSLFKINFPEADANLAPPPHPPCQFFGVLVKSIPLAKNFGRKIYPWPRNFCQKYTLG